MAIKSPLINYHSTTESITLSLKSPSPRYADEFIHLSGISSDILSKGLFPNFKEITESMGLLAAARKHFKWAFPFDSDSTTLISIGDGSSPRTAALFAFRTKWSTISIDPALSPRWTGRPINEPVPINESPPNQEGEGFWIPKHKTTAWLREAPEGIKRLITIGAKVEWLPSIIDFKSSSNILIVACHSHAPLPLALSTIKSLCSEKLEQLSIISLPCCKPKTQSLPFPPDLEYEDFGIWSPHRLIQIWRNPLSLQNSHNRSPLHKAEENESRRINLNEQ